MNRASRRAWAPRDLKVVPRPRPARNDLPLDVGIQEYSDISLTTKPGPRPSPPRFVMRLRSKTAVRIIDFIDAGHSALLRVRERRQRGYRAMGSQIDAGEQSRNE